MKNIFFLKKEPIDFIIRKQYDQCCTPAFTGKEGILWF